MAAERCSPSPRKSYPFTVRKRKSRWIVTTEIPLTAEPNRINDTLQSLGVEIRLRCFANELAFSGRDYTEIPDEMDGGAE